jgi:hypothetical protein
MTAHLFECGQLVATPAALKTLERAGVDPLGLLARHLSGDWGNVDADDALANTEGVRTGDRLLSAYDVLPGGESVWIITEGDRSVTTILLPEDY